MTDIRNIGSLDAPLLIFGGPYSNLAATRAMRARAEQLGIAPANIVCTGDIVAYCAEPAQTVDLIRDWGIHAVMGNCEESLGYDESDCGCGFEPGSSCSVLSITWYDYASRWIDAGQREWMRGLPRQIAFEVGDRRCLVVHGSLGSINEFVFASSDTLAKRADLEAAGVDVIIGGHAGIPFGQAVGEGFWLNAGVIGMPANDGAALTWYLLLEAAAGGGLRASWYRLRYDVDVSRAATIAAGMAEYGDALASGLWPSLDVLPPTERAARGRALELPPISI